MHILGMFAVIWELKKALDDKPSITGLSHSSHCYGKRGINLYLHILNAPIHISSDHLQV